LNNDSEPLSGFVVNALEVMQAKKDVAIVGYMLFFADGKLQASGGLIRADGATFHWGDLDNSKSPIYRVARKVDYAPFAAVLIRNSDLIKVSGFDEQFAPAYYEDVDVAFKLRSLGKSVDVASESKVFHFGSKSYGAGKSDLLISLSLSNRQKFRAKWKETLDAEY
jgi:GT2 family glycosyltransferase